MKFVRFVGSRTCASDGYRDALCDGQHVVLDPSSRESNISVRFAFDGSAVHVPLAPLARDFLDLAACLYVADELASREKTPDRWTRNLDFLVPVRHPQLWEGVNDLLVSTVATLAGDSVAFRWAERSGIVAATRHRKRLPRRFDAVCLFSGGIDSFMGAHLLLKQGRKVLLVGHQADGTTASSQTRLAALLRQEFGSAVGLLQVRVARSLGAHRRFSLPAKEETSHRPRSFLFLAIGVTVASMLGVELVTIPENGLIGLNVPLQRSRFGTLSTRTAHPAVLLPFLELVRSLGLYAGQIKNPFLAQSKTDMLRILDPVVRAGMRQTVSCAKTGRVRWAGLENVRHCGFCVPCIYRRAAMAPAGLDRAEDYEEDIFSVLHTLRPARQGDMRALVQFARETTLMTNARRQLRVTSHGAFSPEDLERLGGTKGGGYAELATMTLRWSKEFLVLLAAKCTPDTRQLLNIPEPRRKPGARRGVAPARTNRSGLET